MVCLLHRICGLFSHRQRLLQTLFPAASSDFITSQPRTTQQMNSNIQHQLHLSTCLFSLLIKMSGFSGNKSNVSGSHFIPGLEYISLLLSYFGFTCLHCNNVFSKTAGHPVRHMMQAEGVWFLFIVSITPRLVLVMLLKSKG